MSTLTKKQKFIFDFITEFLKTHGYSPSYQEIADEFGLSSVATVHGHVKALEDKGFLRSNENQARSIEPVENEQNFSISSIDLPLLGLIAAGEPIEAVNPGETYAVPSHMATDTSYVLQVKGNSMIDEGILSGDLVIVERSFYPKNGDVVVALLDNAFATLKKYYREKDHIRLQPANQAMEPILVKNPAIQGIVKGLIRQFA